MNKQRFIGAVEDLIATQQQTQKTNHPDSPAWQAASAEIHRLAALIVAAQKTETTKEN